MAKDKICTPFLALASPENKFTVDTIEDLKSRKYLKIGDVVELNGYYTAGDGAGHKRKIEATDDGSGVQLANGLWANLIEHLSKGCLDLRWFGAVVGSGDIIPTKCSSDIIMKAIDYTETIMPITWVGNLYIEKEIRTKKYIFFQGKTESTYKIVTWGDNDFFPKNSTTLYISKSLQFAFVMLGAGSPTLSDTRLNIKNVTFKQVDNAKYSTLFRITSSGAPSRGWNTEGCVFLGFEKVFQLLMTSPTSYTATSFWVVRNCHFEKGNYAFTFQGAVPLMHFIFENNICEQGAIFKTLDGHLDGFIQFKNNLFEGQDNLFQLKLGNCYVEIKGNYFEANGGSNIFEHSGNPTSDDFCSANLAFVGNFYGSGCTFTTKIGKKIILKSIEEDFPKNSIQVSDVSGCGNFVINKLAISPTDTRIVTGFSDAYSTSAIQGEPEFISASDIGNTRHIPAKSYRKFDFQKNITANEYFYITGKIMSLANNKKVQLELGAIGGSSTKQLVRNNGNFLVGLKHTTGTSALKVYVNTDESSFIQDISVINIDSEEYLKCIYKPNISSVVRDSLNTPYHTLKMQQEGVYEDFIQYMDEKTEYDRLQRELEQQRQLAFEQSGMENYEEWLAEQPMLLPADNEPQPSEALLKFKEKYLG